MHRTRTLIAAAALTLTAAGCQSASSDRPVTATAATAISAPAPTDPPAATSAATTAAPTTAAPTAPPTTPAPTAPATAAPTTPAPTDPPTTQPASADDLFITWAATYSQTLTSFTSTLADDMQAIGVDAAALDVAALRTDCRTFQKHVATAAGSDASTDPDAPLEWTILLASSGDAATHCLSGEYAAVSTDLDIVTKMSNQIVARINALS